MDKKQLFTIGGLASFAAYFATLFFIWFLTSYKNDSKSILVKSSAPLEVMLQEPIAIEDTVAESSPQPQDVPAQQPKPKAKEKVDKKPPEELGSSHKEPTITKAKKTSEQTTKEESATQQEPMPKRPSAKKLLESLSIVKNAPTITLSAQSGEVSDEYFSKIVQIVQQGWTPLAGDAGMQAVVFVMIEPSGAFVWKIKNSSASGGFNRRLSEYMQRLQSSGFPPPKDAKRTTIEFTFKAKE